MEASSWSPRLSRRAAQPRDGLRRASLSATAVLHDAPGTPPRAREHDVEVPPRVNPDAVAGAEARVAPLVQPFALEGEDAAEPAVVLGDVEDADGVHVEDRRADDLSG